MTQEAMKLALEALEKYCTPYLDGTHPADESITAIKEALAQTQEPVATVESVATVVSESGNQEVTMSWWHEPALPVGTKLYTTPPQRKPLTDEQIWDAYMKAPVDIDCHVSDLHKFARAIEAAHGIKENT